MIGVWEGNYPFHRILTTVACACAFVIVCSCDFFPSVAAEPSSVRGSRQVTATEENIRVPIYTFYERVDFNNDSEGNNHADILKVWADSWTELGWEPRILTLDDAKKHPRYEDYDRALRGLPLDGYSGKNGAYNRLCFLRWLAMGTVGGFFSDFDTVPLVRPTLKDYEVTKTGKFNIYHRFHVPALVSGPKEEWDRMATLLLVSGLEYVENAHKKQDAEPIALWSDMFALQYVVRNDMCDCNIYNQVSEGRVILNGQPITPGDCARYKKDKAAHFSHDSMHHGVLGEGRTINDRPHIMRDWFHMYKDKCGLH